MKLTARVDGFADLERALGGISARMTRQVKVEALTAAAEPIRATASRLAPRRRPDDPKTPNLADNIVTQVTRSSDGSVSVAIGPSKAVPWGRFQELGTAHNAAHPFLRPAYEAHVQGALTIIAPAMWTALASRGIAQSTSAPSIPSGPGRGI